MLLCGPAPWAMLLCRGQAAGGGFWPLNLTRERRRTIDTQVFEAPLPDGVAFARGMFLTPTPALTVLALFFAFEDEPASRVEDVLREPTRSAGRRVGGGWVIDSVPNLRLDRVAHTVGACALWQRLSLGAPPRRVRDRPRRRASRVRGSDNEAVGPARPRPAAATTSAARFVPVGGRAGEPAGGLDRLGIRRLEARAARQLHAVSRDGPVREAERVTGPTAKADPGSPTEQVSSLLFHQMEGVVALWACEELLRGYGVLLGTVRDEVRDAARGVRASLKRLRDRRRRLLGMPPTLERSPKSSRTPPTTVRRDRGDWSSTSSRCAPTTGGRGICTSCS